jgi:hypothetical protein
LRKGPNCEFRWVMRNNIYAQHGYCFHTQRAIQEFGNTGCKFSEMDRVPLNQFERANASTIQSVETSMHCSVD